MSLLVFVTESCRDDARQHTLLNELEKFRERVETTQSTSLFDAFPPPYLVKKKLGGRQGRLIATLRTVEDQAVIIFMAILMRGGHAYEDEFGPDPIAYGEQHFRDLVTDQQLVEFVRERTRTQPPEPKPEPTSAEYELLYGAFAHHQEAALDDLVCETNEWVMQVSQDRIAKQLALLCAPCLAALGSGPGLHFMPVHGKTGWGAWVRRSPGRLLLISVSTETTTAEAKDLAERTARELDGKDADAVLRASRRAYPALILADDELWIDLEKEPVANMALSPEESEVLESARRSEHPFPLFINGRAGSGKSTILQYLFADLLFHYLSRPDVEGMAPPVYLTANGELLRIARGFVERLLRSEAAFTQQLGGEIAKDRQDTLDEAFREFQPHLLSLVPKSERVTRFSRGAHVNYARFRRMWVGRFGKDKKAWRECGPDLSWHIIRSYIKGMSPETYLDPLEYAQLPDNQLTVTHAAYKLVFDRVWPWYQQALEEAKLWDDQDLTRDVLERDLAAPTYPAVVCDEAQDFTRLELELLFRVNLFSNRTLPLAGLSRVPFAFAGDQFQTLNPTGFRWDSIKASFVEKFVLQFDPARKSGRVDLNYRELQYNYRSTHKIVRFGNHVQAMRAALFDLPDVNPQMPWTIERHSFPVVWFRSSDAVFWKKFRESPGLIVIVPCNEGEETEFVQADPILAQHIKFEDGVPVNVLSPARAKGCEYPAVVVYGFGEKSPADVLAELTGATNELEDLDESLPIQYFVNRLYVAVSRPKQRLMIVDSDDGFKKLWTCVRDENAESIMLGAIKNGRERWAAQIEGMTIGNPEDLTRESAGDPLENAKTFEADGLARQDAFLLRQAAQAYRSGGDLLKARECRARALEADGNYLEAGESYFDAGFAVPDGVRCLWRAGQQGWSRLTEKLSQAAHIQQELEFQWARLLASHAGSEKQVEILARFAQHLNDEAFQARAIGESSWREALAASLKASLAAKSPSGSASDELWGRLAGLLESLQAKGISLPASESASVYFRAKQYAKAIGLWDKVSETKSKEYSEAKAYVEPYPARVKPLADLGLHDEIVEGYTASPGTRLSEDQAGYVVDALCERGHFDDAFVLAWKQGLAKAMLRIALRLRRSSEMGDMESANRALHAGLALSVQGEQWDAVATFASTGDFVPEPAWKEGDLRGWVKDEEPGLQVTLVRAIARSESLADAPQGVQRRLANFMKRFLKARGADWPARLSLAEAGAAVERGGRFVEALAFYESMLERATNEGEVRHAWERVVVSKQRQLDHEKKQGINSKTRDLEREVKSILADLDTKGDKLPAYPSLPALDVATLAPAGLGQQPAYAVSEDSGLNHTQLELEEGADSEAVIAVAHFKLEMSRRNGRCNITNARTMETAFVKMQEKICGGEVEFVPNESGRWTCQAWNMTIQLPVGNSDLIIGVEDAGVKVHLRP